MKYALYYRIEDGRLETEIAENAKDRDIRIDVLSMFRMYTDACWCKIYASGEYGKRNLIIGKLENCL